MLPPRDVADVVASLPVVHCRPSARPPLRAGQTTATRLVLGVASMKHHMTDEGWQLTHGLSRAPFPHLHYKHCGYDLPEPSTDVPDLLARYNPSIVVLQDKREWAPTSRTFRDQNAFFSKVQALQAHASYKLTVLKDAQQNPEWHKQSADEIGAHGWIIYYHPEIVKRLAPYVRIEDCIRTYHTLDLTAVPIFNKTDRQHSIISGAVSAAYPFRQQIIRNLHKLSPITYLQHPGYHRNGTNTPEYMRTLAQYKVAICTSSKYGYALRKVIEATACGCRVITDLPVDDVLPGIDNNLIRVHPTISMEELRKVLHDAAATWDADTQYHYRQEAMFNYDYTHETARLAMVINSRYHEVLKCNLMNV